MNKKGQALVEFVLVLPVLLIIVISLIDVGSIFIKKYELSKDLEIISEYFENNKTQELYAYAAIEEVDFSVEERGDIKVLNLKKNVKINAPILSNIIGKNYTIEVDKPVIKGGQGE